MHTDEYLKLNEALNKSIDLYRGFMYKLKADYIRSNKVCDIDDVVRIKVPMEVGYTKFKLKVIRFDVNDDGKLIIIGRKIKTHGKVATLVTYVRDYLEVKKVE